ncbi:MAG: Jag N-terminal domain-containing protein, partial [Acidimicrobiales bacterium]
MEWVEVAGKTVEEATERALDQLGVAVGDAEVIVVSEPKTGLFGRMRVEARVRARVRPVGARPRRERPRRGGKSGQAGRQGGQRQGSGGGSASRDKASGSPESGEGSDSGSATGPNGAKTGT